MTSFDHYLEPYPVHEQWLAFFNAHESFWFYITNTAKSLFFVPTTYPCSADNSLQAVSLLASLEDFFALYFLLIVYHSMNGDKDDQALWKSLWERELWAKRVTEEEFVTALHNLKNSLLQAPYVAEDTLTL